MSGEVVPFGRYKGKPVEDMLADTSYMTWVETQPWFRERYLHLLARRDADAASRTPVHNRLQTLFLNADYRMAFAAASGVQSGLEKERAERAASVLTAAVKEKQQRYDRVQALKQRAKDAALECSRAEDQDEKDDFGKMPEWFREQRRAGVKAAAAASLQTATEQKDFAERVDRILAEMAQAQIRWASTARFEVTGRPGEGGGDVVLNVTATAPMLNDFDRGTEPTLGQEGFAERAVLEIKPSVADDYPAVLRQMERNGSSYLFVADYIGEGATEAQFVSIFAASGKTVVFKRDVDREVARAMLAKLDAAGVSLTLRPDGKILLGANAREHPDAVAAAREHRDAIVAYLQEQIREADRAPAIPDDGTL